MDRDIGSGRRLMVAVLVGAAALAQPARGETVNWTSASAGNWSSGANWSGGAAPGKGATEGVDVAHTLFGPLGARITYDAAAGTSRINSFISSGPFVLAGGYLTVGSPETPGTMQVDNAFTMDGGTLVGATINPGSGGQGVTFTNNDDNVLRYVTSNAPLDLTAGFAGYEQVLNVNGRVNLDRGGVLMSRDGGTHSIGGSAEILFGASLDFNPTPSILGNDSGTGTLESGVLVHGCDGIVQGWNMVNKGTISADVNSAIASRSGQRTLRFEGSMTNFGTLEAKNGGILELDGDVTNDASAGGGKLQTDAASFILAARVEIAGGSLSGNLRCGPQVKLDGFTVNTGSLLDLLTEAELGDPSVSVEITNGLTLNGRASLGGTLRSNAANTISGSGEVLFAGGGRLEIFNSQLTVDTNVLVHGQNGFIDFEKGSSPAWGGTGLVNKGVIAADVSEGKITVDLAGVPDEISLKNSGVLKAKNGGTLELKNLSTQGLLEVEAPALDDAPLSRVLFRRVHLEGGTLRGTGGSGRRLFNWDGSSGNEMLGVTLDGDLVMTGFNTRIENGLTLGGRLDLQVWNVDISGSDQTIAGNGEVRFGAQWSDLEPPTPEIVYLDSGVSRLTLETGVTMHGSHAVVGASELVNKGTFSADLDGRLDGQPGTLQFAGDHLTNLGTLGAKNGASLWIHAATTSSGNVQVDAGGTLGFGYGGFTQTAGSTVVNGALGSWEGFNIEGGMLGGAGTIVGNVNNTGGTLSPGNSAGSITIDGSYMQGSGAALFIELAGIGDRVQHDMVRVNGAAHLDGILEIGTLNGFWAPKDSYFDIFEADSITGNWSQVRSLNEAYTYRLEFIVGDGVGKVARLFVDQAPPSPVPEPASLALFGPGLAAAALLRRRKKNQA